MIIFSKKEKEELTHSALYVKMKCIFTEHYVCGKGETFGESKKSLDCGGAGAARCAVYRVFHARSAVFALPDFVFSGRTFFAVLLFFALWGCLFSAGFCAQSAAQPAEHGALRAARLSDGVLHRQTFPAQGHDDGAGRLPDVHQPGHPLL